ncbi:MAG TPA: NUDIX hydrolase [Limnochordia bacterium]
MADPPNRMIRCRTLHGREEEVFAGALRFRPACYGVAIDANGRVLLARSVFHRLWELPGGGIEPWETLPEGLAREFAEETGVRPVVEEPLGFDEGFITFFRHAFHSLRFFFRVRMPEDAALRPQPREVADLAWRPIAELRDAELVPGHLRFIGIATGAAEG